jgi:hypothetical protein
LRPRLPVPAHPPLQLQPRLLPHHSPHRSSLVLSLPGSLAPLLPCSLGPLFPWSLGPCVPNHKPGATNPCF